MTIKKNGGVFGRNPKFRNVAVDTLTVGGALATFPATSFTAARTDAAQSFTGDQTLATGNLVIGTAGKGIDFSADPSAAGMTSELLDDYEEGTWTPSDSSGAGLVFTVSDNKYTKTGRVVNCSALITFPTTESALNAQISGLPFVCGNYTLGQLVGFFGVSGSVSVAATLSDLYLRDLTGVSLTNATLSTKDVAITISYQV